jgi:hypothetical protein
MTMPALKSGAPIRDWYRHIPKIYHRPKVSYESYDKTRIDLPFAMAILGKTGSGKNQALMHIIERINAWEEYYLCIANADQPLWAFFIDQLRKIEAKAKKQVVWICDTPSAMPNIDEFKYDGKQRLWIYDDQLLKDKKEQAIMAKPFVYGRNLGISSCVLSQSWFGIPRVVRLQVSYIILKKLNSRQDIKRIIADTSISVDVDTLTKLYEQATENVNSFLFIDKNTIDDSLKYRFNLGDA